MRRLSPLLLLALLACHRGEDQEDEAPDPAIPVVCAAARAGAAADTVTLRGVVAAPPERHAVVAPQVAGRVSAMQVREGDRVAAGDLLAVIDDPSLATGVDEAASAAAAAKARLENAEASLARARRLFDEGIAPRRDLEDAQARRAEAAAASRAAASRRTLAARQQQRARVRAPIAGVVVRVLRRRGELVDGTPATPVVEIADPAALELRADAPAGDLVRVKTGAAAEIELAALPGETLRGSVVFASPAVDPKTSLGVVRASIDEAPKGAQLVLGLGGTLTLHVGGGKPGVLVPAAAIRRSPQGTQEVVLCADEGGVATARVRPVEVGHRAGDDVAIERGVAAGDRVVVHHLLGLEDGARIEPQAADRGPK